MSIDSADATAGHEAVAYVATQQAAADEEMILELRATEDDDLAVLAYSGLGQLVTHCGEYQPWVAVPQSWLPDLVRRSGADRIVWDQTLGAEQRHQQPPEPAPPPAADEQAQEGASLRDALGKDVVTSDDDPTMRDEG